MPSDRSSLKALKNLLTDTDLILETTLDLPQNRTGCCRENLRAAIALVNDLLKHQSSATSTAAAVMGSKGGSVTSKKFGPEHYRRMAAARKSYSGGRPRKQPE